MLPFISTGTYFKLLDLEISGDIEMIGDVICIYIYIYMFIYVYRYNSFYSQHVSLVPLHPEMFTNIYIWGTGHFLSYKLFSESGQNL